MSGFALHTEAYKDLDEIRANLAEESLDAADRVVSEIFDRLRRLAAFPCNGRHFDRSRVALATIKFGH